MTKKLLAILAVLAMSGMAMAQTAPSDVNLHRNEDGSWSFIMPGRNLVMSTETFSTNDTVNGHYLAGVPEGWLILALGDTVPVSNDSLRRTTPITEGTPVTIVPTGNLRRIKSITLVDELPPVVPLDNPAPTTASIEDYTAGTFGWDGDGSAATGLPTINTFAANDEISILSAKNTNTQFTTSEGGASATFSGTAADDSKFYAVYPYTVGLILSGDVISGVVIPTSQWNSGWNSEDDFSGWDPKAPIAYATTTGSSLTFHNACAILKVTFPEAGTYGRFTISANEPLAGTFSLDTSTGTLTPTSGSTTVTVGNPSDIWSGICTDFNGKTVYVAIAPGTYTDFNLHIYNEDDDEKSNTKSSVTFEAGKIYDLGSYDLMHL